ncbi:hypothetical protein GRI43_07050 [Altererythrobacter luteolus]|uniref:Uncharacterized protein n=1 Tax=Pontixanthobacter luteolus TaxID=295089 RepID=A0A6I4V0A7_9SPHN|nr:hypothetical protein [Pontixanthobacter luteolus]MXP47145.1 hypothetical protein [Pontixanthobacter luteolus]
MNFSLAAIGVLLPVMIGPLPADDGMQVLQVQLCSGGAISIPIGEQETPPGQPCPAKACHAGACRKKI